MSHTDVVRDLAARTIGLDFGAALRTAARHRIVPHERLMQAVAALGHEWSGAVYDAAHDELVEVLTFDDVTEIYDSLS